MCLTFAELAGKSRADTPATERHKLPYHFVMVDEAPTLMEHSIDAIESFASELRKYKVSIILGMQGIKDQLPKEVASAIFRNFGTLLSFRLGEPDDAEYVNRSMPSEVLEESDYLQVEPFHAYIRMQVKNERTRPFLIRMKAPGPALYEEFIQDINERTAEEAEAIERQAVSTAGALSKHVEHVEVDDYLFLDEDQDESQTEVLESEEDLSMLTGDKENTDLFNQMVDLDHKETNVQSNEVFEDLLFLDMEQTQQEIEQSMPEKSSSVSKDDSKEEQLKDIEKVSITKDDLWV